MIERGHAARPARGHRHARRRSPSGRRRAGCSAPAITVVGPVAALRARARLARVAAAGRADGRGHPGAGAGQRAGGAAARPRRRRRRGAGDPDRSRSTGPPPTSARYDLVCLTSPNGGAAAVRAPAPRRARRARLRRARASRRSGPGRRRRCASTASIADVVPERFVAEGLVEALADVPVSRALIARAARGPRRAPRRAARARRRGRRAGPVRDGGRAAVRAPSARRWPAPTT